MKSNTKKIVLNYRFFKWIYDLTEWWRCSLYKQWQIRDSESLKSRGTFLRIMPLTTIKGDLTSKYSVVVGLVKVPDYPYNTQPKEMKLILVCRSHAAVAPLLSQFAAQMKKKERIDEWIPEWIDGCNTLHPAGHLYRLSRLEAKYKLHNNLKMKCSQLSELVLMKLDQWH